MQQQPDIATLLYRVEDMSKDIEQLQKQLGSYETSREIDLKLQRIGDALQRFSVELGKINDHVNTEFSKMSDRLEAMNTKMTAQDTDARRRDDATKESLSKLQIKALWFLVSTVIGVIVGILVIVGARLFTP